MNFPIIDVYEHPHYGDSVRYENYVELQEKIEALLARHTALVEAVAWERECEVVMGSLWFYYEGKCPYKEARVSVEAARAEVDRLIADCKGEGRQGGS